MEEIESLVAKVANGDAPAAERLAAFGEIVRRYQDMAYGCAYAVLGDFHLAEDAAQEAFLTAYRELRSLREAGAFAGWLRRIVLSRCSRMTRRRSVSTTRLDAAATVASNEPGPTEAMEMRELKDKVLAAVRALPEPQRMVTTLFYINGYSQKDIAEFLEVPVTTVKKRLVASRGRLKQRMMVMVDETLKSFPLSGDFADIVVRKAGSAEDLQRAAALLGYSSRKRPQHFQSPAGADEAGLYVVGQEGAVEGAGYFNEFPLGIGGTVLTAARPNEMGAESVGVPDPAFVRSFRACFKLARERGIHLAACHGSQYDHAFCGFVPCFYYPVVTLPCEVGRSVDSGATLIEATAGQKEAAREAWLRDPYAPRMSAYLGGGAPHVVVQDGEVVGYARVDRDFRPTERHNMPFGHITDVTVRTRDAALAVIRVGAGLAEQGGQDKLWLMQSHRTRITRTMLSLGGTYLLRGPCDLPGLDAEMVAIVDLVGLTKELQGELQARMSASAAHDVEAAFSIKMGGETIGFVAEGGQLKIVSEKQRTHRRLPRWVVTRAYMGYYSGGDVLAMGPIPWDRSDGKTPDEPALDRKHLDLPEEEAALFRALFPKLWPVSWPDPDVWPWVIGKEHPRYQNEAGKTPETKARIDSLRFPWVGR